MQFQQSLYEVLPNGDIYGIIEKGKIHLLNACTDSFSFSYDVIEKENIQQIICIKKYAEKTKGHYYIAKNGCSWNNRMAVSSRVGLDC